MLVTGRWILDEPESKIKDHTSRIQFQASSISTFFQQRYKTLRIGCQERKCNNMWWIGSFSFRAFIFEEYLEIDTPVAK
jgi:hypothetical protein